LDIIEKDNEGRVDRATLFAQQRAWEIHSNLWYAPIPERMTATGRWGRATLIIAALSTLSWAVLVLAGIEALAYLQEASPVRGVVGSIRWRHQ
jgi:hypothetical protein